MGQNFGEVWVRTFIPRSVKDLLVIDYGLALGRKYGTFLNLVITVFFGLLGWNETEGFLTKYRCHQKKFEKISNLGLQAGLGIFHILSIYLY